MVYVHLLHTGYYSEYYEYMSEVHRPLCLTVYNPQRSWRHSHKCSGHDFQCPQFMLPLCGEIPHCHHMNRLTTHLASSTFSLLLCLTSLATVIGLEVTNSPSGINAMDKAVLPGVWQKSAFPLPYFVKV